MIETPRLVLREPDRRDHQEVERLFTDPTVMRHYRAIALPGAGQRWLSAIGGLRARYGCAPWTVETRSGAFVGQCGPLPLEIDGATEIEIICFLARPYWRDGYSDEACNAAIEAAFHVLGAPRIIALVYPDNRPARRLARRCGLRFERDLLWDGATMSLFARATVLPSAGRAGGPQPVAANVLRGSATMTPGRTEMSPGSSPNA